MRFLPVVGRELNAIARRPSAYWLRAVAAAAAFLVIGYIALIGGAGTSTTDQGRSLFNMLSIGAFACCAFAGVRGTSDALSQEKREGTLGLLFLTDLKGYDVVLGKIVSVSMNSVYAVLAVAPALALAFMLGGVSGFQFLLMVACLVNTLFFSLAVGILVSTFSKHERPAMGITLAIIFVVLVIPFAVALGHTYNILEVWEVLMPGFLLESPIFALWAIKDGTLLRIYSEEIFLSLAFAHLSGWLCLVVASASVAARAQVNAPRNRLMEWFWKVRQEWAYGKAARRRGIRGGLLDRSAFAWLAGRDRLKGHYAWIFLFLLGGLWAVARWKSPEVMEEWPVTLFSLWFLQLFFKIWVASEVAARFIEDRRSNALELLLTTPMKIRDFAIGEWRALLRQFGAPIAAVLLLNGIACVSAHDGSAYLLRGARPGEFFGAGLLHLAFDLYAIFWTAIWRSLHLRGTNRTITQTIFLVVIAPVIGWFFLWQGSWMFASATGRPTLGASGVLSVWTLGCVAWDVFLARVAQQAFYRDFRVAATRTFDKPAPFKWKIPRQPARPTARFRRLARFTTAAGVMLICFCIWAALRRHRLEKEAARRIAAVVASSSTTARAITPRGASATLVSASRIFKIGPPPPQLRETDFRFNSRDKLPLDFKPKATAWVDVHEGMFQILEKLPELEPGGHRNDFRFGNPVMAEDLAHSLQLKALLEIEDAPAKAAKTIRVLLHLARTLEGEPFGGFGGTRRSLREASELMARGALLGTFSKKDWEEWREILAALKPLVVLQDSLVSERLDGLQVFMLPPEHLFQRFGFQFVDMPWLFNVSWAIRRFFGQDQVEIIEYLDVMGADIEGSKKPFWSVPRNPSGRGWKQITPASSTFIAPQMLPAFDALFLFATEAEAHRQIMMAVAQVEIYRASTGHLPESLKALGRPELIDPFDGKPLRYARRGEEYSIYSVGADGADNGGAAWTSRNSGDIAFHCGPAPEPKRKINKP